MTKAPAPKRTRGAPTPATPEQLMRNGAVAGRVREAMRQMGMSAIDFNKAAGLARSSTTIYMIRAAKLGVGKSMLERINRILRIPMEDLVSETEGRAPTYEPSREPAPTTQAPRLTQVLGFSLLSNGQARISLDIVLDIAEALPLAKLLMDHGIIIGAKQDKD